MLFWSGFLSLRRCRAARALDGRWNSEREDLARLGQALPPRNGARMRSHACSRKLLLDGARSSHFARAWLAWRLRCLVLQGAEVRADRNRSMIDDPAREIALRIRLAKAGPQPSLVGPLIPVMLAGALLTDMLMPAMTLLNCVAPLAGFGLAWLWDEPGDGRATDGAVSAF